MTRTRPPRYRLALAGATHLSWGGNHPLRSPDRAYGSKRPFVAAVLVLYAITDDDAKPTGVSEWWTHRTSYTKVAAQEYCDRLRGRGRTAVVVDMEPAPVTAKKRKICPVCRDGECEIKSLRCGQ